MRLQMAIGRDAFLQSEKTSLVCQQCTRLTSDLTRLFVATTLYTTMACHCREQQGLYTICQYVICRKLV